MTQKKISLYEENSRDPIMDRINEEKLSINRESKQLYEGFGFNLNKLKKGSQSPSTR